MLGEGVNRNGALQVAEDAPRMPGRMAGRAISVFGRPGDGPATCDRPQGDFPRALRSLCEAYPSRDEEMSFANSRELATAAAALVESSASIDKSDGTVEQGPVIYVAPY